LIRFIDFLVEAGCEKCHMNTNGKVNVGIDIGGTKINIGLIDEAGNIIENKVLPTQKSVSCIHQIDFICNELNQLIESKGLLLSDINFIGAGIPGTVSYESGFVTYGPNINWVNEPAGEYFEKCLGSRVVLCQDSYNAALAEFLLGAGQGLTNILCLTIGTGIGGGIILNKKLHFGSFGTAGEVGHMILHKNGRQCNCGKRGCFERYVSGTGLLEIARESLPDGQHMKSAKMVFEMARQKNEIALKIFNEWVDDFAVGIANVVNVLSVEAVILSGGLSENKDMYMEPLKERILQHGYIGWAKHEGFKILHAQMGKNAPMIGASLLYQVT